MVVELFEENSVRGVGNRLESMWIVNEWESDQIRTNRIESKSYA